MPSQLDFTLSDLEEIKVAVSEAVGNSIIHGYENHPDKKIRIQAALTTDSLELRMKTTARALKISKALEPAFSTDSERLGLGFVFMQSFYGQLQVDSTPGQGTKVIMSKRVGSGTAPLKPEQ